MELKQYYAPLVPSDCAVLIVPSGIETNEINQAILAKEVLIVPSGIETIIEVRDVIGILRINCT